MNMDTHIHTVIIQAMVMSSAELYLDTYGFTVSF